jgi:hypothetical protein
MGQNSKANYGMDTPCKTEGLSQLPISETINRGTVCRKAARTDLWGSGEETISYTRNQLILIISKLCY